MRRYGTLAFRPEGDGGETTPTGWVAPEDWPDQFKDPAKLLESYKEAQSAMNRTMQERDAERQQFAAALEAIDKRPAPVPANSNGTADPVEAAWTAALESGDASAAFRAAKSAAVAESADAFRAVLDERLGQIQPVLDQQQAAQRESSIRMAEDIAKRSLGTDPAGKAVYDELLPKISQLVQEHPHYLPAQASVEGYAAAILDVAKLAQHESLTAQIASLEQERADKLGAQTVSGAGRGSVYTEDEQKEIFNRVKNTPTGSFSELMSRRPA